MARYQIRIPENIILDDIIEKMAGSAWKVLESWEVFAPAETTSQDYRRFRERIRAALLAHLRTYRLCGLSNICAENLRSSPWAPESHVLDATPWDLVYHLFPGVSLEDFLNEISWIAVTSIRHLLKPETENSVFSALRMVFQTMLGEYMYLNPLCGKTELCVYSSSAPTDLWKERGKVDYAEVVNDPDLRGSKYGT